MAIHIQASAAPSAQSTVTLASIWGVTGTVFLCAGVVYVIPATSASGGGYVTVTRLSDGENTDLLSNSDVLLAQAATLVASF